MKSKIISRKHILAFTLTFSLALAVFVNWYYTKPDSLQNQEPDVTDNISLGDAQLVNGTSVSENYFENARLNRTKAHDSAKESLQIIINDTSTDEDTKASSREKLTRLSEFIKLEADCENLITAQISKECLVTLDYDSAEVIVPKGTIDEKMLIKIKDIILTKSKVKAENITIIELK